MSDAFARHEERVRRAWEACMQRDHWSPFPDLPAAYPDSDAAQAAGKAAFAAQLGHRFALELPGTTGWIGAEISPYTQAPLGITYPQAHPGALFAAAAAAQPAWGDADPNLRIGVLMDVVDALYARSFELAWSVFHTAGQSFNMSFAGSTVNAFDRAIEVLAHAWHAMDVIPREATWSRAFGSATIALRKTYRLVPRGVAVCFTCASFPTWNAYPSIMASLATGNAVIIKPHPATILPIAISVAVFRDVLAAAGFDPNLVTLAVDTVADPIGIALVKHPATAIVDFTGSVRFGSWIERNAAPALAFTETAGVNTVVLHSCEDMEAVARSLATTLCLYSAQMCTSPQNIYIPREGVRVGAGDAARMMPFVDVADAIAGAVRKLTADPKRAAAIMGSIQSPATLDLIGEMAAGCATRGAVLLAPEPFVNPEFPAARTSTPLIARLTTAERDIYAEERFGPIAFVIETADADDALAQATGDVATSGGLTAFLYSTDPAYVERAERAYARAGAQLTINLTGPMPLNFAAAYSDYHVTGLNPAGNAALTDLAFVTSRFLVAQSRQPA